MKVVALEHNTSVSQPTTLKEDEPLRRWLPWLRSSSWWPPMAKFCPNGFWTCPPKAASMSLLAAAPVSGGGPHQLGHPEWGETETGVTIMYMAEGLDTGDIIAQRATPSTPNETVESSTTGWQTSAPSCWGETVAAIGAGHRTSHIPGMTKSCYAPMLSRELSPLIFPAPPSRFCTIRCGG